MAQLSCDLLVIGCGVVGASTAFQAARAGLKVIAIDARMPTAGTSGACDGYIAISSKKPGLMMDLVIASKALFPTLVKHLRLPTEYHVAGGVLICEDEATAAATEAHAEAVRATGTEMTFLDKKRLLALEPYLSPTLYGAYHIPSEAAVSPYQWALALADGATGLGVRTFWNTRPLAFDIAGDQAIAVDTTAGRIEAGQIAITSGVWSRFVGALAGLNLPIEPRRGELVVTDRKGRVANGKLLSAKYLTVKGDPEAVARSTDPVMRLGHGFSLEVNGLGQAIIGGTRAFVGFDRRATALGVRTILSEAVKRVPALATCRIVRTFAGLRPYVPDGKPIIGRSSLVKNVIVAAGHEGDGISLSAVTGQIVTAIATGKKPAVAIDALTPDRFGGLDAKARESLMPVLP